MERKTRTPCLPAAALAALLAACPASAAEPVVQWAVSTAEDGPVKLDSEDYYGWDVDYANNGRPRRFSVLDAAGNLFVVTCHDILATPRLNKFSPTGSLIWSNSLMADGYFSAACALTIDAAGDVVYLSDTYGRAGVIKLRGTDGKRVWSRDPLEVHTSEPRAVAVSPSGDIFVNDGWRNERVQKLNANDGSTAWSVNLSGLSSQLLADADGNVISVSKENASGTGTDTRLRKLSGVDGSILWSVRYDHQGRDDAPYAAKRDAAGNIVICGTTATTDDNDIFTAVFRPTDGSLKWDHRWTGAGAGSQDVPENVAVGTTGDVVVAGRTGNSAATDMVVYRLRASDGAPVWTDRTNNAFVFAGAGNGHDIARDVAIDPAGDVVVVGQVSGAASGDDFAVLKLRGSDGSPAWSQHPDGIWKWNPAGGSDIAYSLCLDAGGGIVASGSLWGSDVTRLDIGIARLDADGVPTTTVWNRPYQTATECMASDVHAPSGLCRGLVLDPAGNSWVLGRITNKALVLKFDSAGNRVGTKTVDVVSPNSANTLLRHNDGTLTAILGSGSNIVVFKIRETDGELLWNRLLSYAPTKVFYAVGQLDSQGNVIVGARDQTSFGTIVTKLGAADGAPLWTELTNAIYKSADDFRSIHVGPDDNPIVLGTASTVKIRGSDGSPIWSTSRVGYGAAFATDNDVLLAGDGTLVRLRAADGLPAWTQPVGGVVSTLVGPHFYDKPRINAEIGPDGHLLIGGRISLESIGFAKYRISDGSPVWTDLPDNTSVFSGRRDYGETVLRSMAVNPAGDIVFTCLFEMYLPGRGDWATVKLRGADGRFAWTDTPRNAITFGGSYGAADCPAVVKFAPDGSILVAGNVYSTDSRWDIALVKYVEAEKPTVTATFLSSPVAAGGETRIRFDLTNPNPDVTLHYVQFSVALPAALEIAALPDVLNELGGTLTAVPGGSSIKLVAASLPAGATLSIEVTLLAKVAGVHRCTTSVVRSDEISGTATAFDDLEIVPGPAAALNIGGFPSPVDAGAVGTFEVQVFDAFGNLATNFTGTVKFRSSDPSAAVPADHAFTEADAGRRTFAAVLRTGGLHGITVELAADAGIADTQGDISVVVHAPQIAVTFLTSPAASGSVTRVRFDLTNPNPSLALTGVFFEAPLPTAGVLVAAAPAALNQLGGTLTAPAGGSTIALVGGSLPAGATKSVEVDLVARAAGIHRCTVGRPGSNETGLGSTAFDDLTVVAGPAALLDILGFPSPVNAGASGNFEVRVFDAYGNQAVSFTGAVKFLSSDPAATLPANYTFVVGDAGRRTFSATLRTGGPQSLTVELVADAGVTDTQSGIEVVALPPQIAVTFLASPVSSGSNTRIRFDLVNPNPSLALTGVGFENPIPAALQVAGVPDVLNELGGTLTAASGGSLIKLVGGSLPAGATKSVEVDLLAKIKGTHVNTVGPASADGVGAGSGASDDVTIVPGVAALFELAGFPTSIAAGTPGGFEVKVFDAHGNLATNFTGTVRFTSSDPAATLPANRTFTLGDAGRRAFTATLRTFGTHSLGVEALPGPAVDPAPASDVQTDILVGDALNRITAAVSRRTHLGVGRSIPLALGVEPDTATVEPRVGGATQVVLTFGRAMKSVKGVKPGSGHIDVENAELVSAEWNDAKTKLTLNLTATDSTWIRINLDPEKFTQGGSVLWGSTQVCVRVLTGDVDGNGTVDSADVALVRALKGKAATAGNFRRDINRNGVINEADAQWVLAALGRTAP